MWMMRWSEQWPMLTYSYSLNSSMKILVDWVDRLEGDISDLSNIACHYGWYLIVECRSLRHRTDKCPDKHDRLPMSVEVCNRLHNDVWGGAGQDLVDTMNTLDRQVLMNERIGIATVDKLKVNEINGSKLWFSVRPTEVSKHVSAMKLDWLVFSRDTACRSSSARSYSKNKLAP